MTLKKDIEGDVRLVVNALGGRPNGCMFEFALVLTFSFRRWRTMVVFMHVEVIHSVMVTVLLHIFVLLVPMLSLMLGLVLLPTINVPLISVAMAMLLSRLLPVRLVILVIFQVLP